MKRSMNRIVLRLAMLVVAIVLGAIAVSQAQKGLKSGETATSPDSDASDSQSLVQQTQPIPPGDFTNTDVYDGGFREAVPDASAPQEPTQGFTDDSPYVDPSSGFSEPPPAQLEFAQQEYSEPEHSQPAPPEFTQPLASTPSVGGGSMYDDAPPNVADPASSFVEQPSDVQLMASEEPSEEMTIAPPQSDLPYEAGPEEQEGFAELPPLEDLDMATDDPGSIEGHSEESHFADAPAEFAESNTPVFDDDPAIDPGNDPVLPAVTDVAASTEYTGTATIEVAKADTSMTGHSSEPATLSTQPSTTMAADEGSGKPGPASMEGPQTPTLTVVKTAPPEIQVGKPARFQVTVRNIGSVDAENVVIRDEVPHGTHLIQATPTASQSAEGVVLWEMGTIRPGSEVTAVMEVMPQVEGDIGSVAKISFQAAVSAKSLSTKPQLVLEHTGPGQILVGDDVVFHIKLSNPGTGIAHNVRLEEDVPSGLRHVDGHELEYHVGTIRPGETRLLELTLKADKPGQVDNLLMARADSDLVAENVCQLQIVAPALQVAIDGPQKRYLNRRASFQVKVANPGSAPAHNVKLVARLPKGLKFESTNNAGQYNSQDHSVYWNLAELPAGEMGAVELVANPVAMGDQRIRVESNAEMGLTDSADHSLSVEGLVALLFTLTDADDPIEIDGQTTYEIRVLNQGSKTATNLRVNAIIPDGMQAINGEGPTRVAINGQQVSFEPLARLTPQASSLFKIHVKGQQPGDWRIKVQLASDEITDPVTKEESTHVYADE